MKTLHDYQRVAVEHLQSHPRAALDTCDCYVIRLREVMPR